MGCISSDPQDSAVKKELAVDAKADSKEIKLLLLGAGGSGKTTLFKQLQYIHGDGYSQRQRILFQKQIHEQLIDSMKTLITRCEEYYDRDPSANEKYKLYDYELDEQSDDEDGGGGNNDIKQNDDDIKVRNCADAVVSVRNNQKLTKEMIFNLKFLWNNATIKEMWDIRNEICVPDSTEYFFKDLERITSDKYIPTDDDLIMVRYRTTGMQEKRFKIKKHWFKICDVGGQRNERRKWIHFFNNVTSVIFVVSLSCYDELTFEEEENTMVDSLGVWKENINNEYFQDMAFILFLNKSDLYADKIKRVPITAAPCFNAYDGTPDDADESLGFIKKVFQNENKNDEREIFIHTTCATNKDQIERVFSDVQTMIINWALEGAGLT